MPVVIPVDSVLNTIKKVLGYEPAYEAFDEDIMMHVNSVFSTLTQIGVGPIAGFSITGPEVGWSTFMGTATNLQEVKTYMYLRVKLIFDTPATSFVIKSMEDQIKEYEWRLNLKEEEAPTP